MIRTDFSKVKRLVLVYPKDIREDGNDYGVLDKFYDELTLLVPEEIHVIVFVKSQQIGQRIKELRKNLHYVVVMERMII